MRRKDPVIRELIGEARCRGFEISGVFNGRAWVRNPGSLGNNEIIDQVINVECAKLNFRHRESKQVLSFDLAMNCQDWEVIQDFTLHPEAFDIAETIHQRFIPRRA